LPRNSLLDLRNHLFEALERLKDDDKEHLVELERAKAIAQVAQVIIESAKVEIKAAELLGLEPKEGFFTVERRQPERPSLSAVPNNGKRRPA
jgi:hypothetical protein